MVSVKNVRRNIVRYRSICAFKDYLYNQIMLIAIALFLWQLDSRTLIYCDVVARCQVGIEYRSVYLNSVVKNVLGTTKLVTLD